MHHATLAERGLTSLRFELPMWLRDRLLDEARRQNASYGPIVNEAIERYLEERAYADDHARRATERAER